MKKWALYNFLVQEESDVRDVRSEVGFGRSEEEARADARLSSNDIVLQVRVTQGEEKSFVVCEKCGLPFALGDEIATSFGHLNTIVMILNDSYGSLDEQDRFSGRGSLRTDGHYHVWHVRCIKDQGLLAEWRALNGAMEEEYRRHEREVSAHMKRMGDLIQQIFRGLYTRRGSHGRIAIGHVLLLWWAMLTLSILAWSLQYNPEWSFGDVMQVVVASLVLIGVVPSGILWLIKRRRLHSLFTLEHQPTADEHRMAIEHDASSQEQKLNLTIRMSLETYVEFVILSFVGSGAIPIIKRLGDWQWAERAKPFYLSTGALPDGRWYWRYETPEHKWKDRRVTIAVDYTATAAFDGRLVVEMTTRDGLKEHSLPIRVRPSTPDTGANPP